MSRLSDASHDSEGAVIPVYRPELTAEDVQAVAAAVEGGWVSGNAPVVRDFEQRFASYCGAAAGAATSSGTAALETALIALRIGAGDEVICPSLTIVSCARAIVAVGATPVFVDVEPKTFGLDTGAALRHVTKRTRAILAVHLFGYPVDVEALGPARDEGIAIVEDCAQAIGSELEVGGRSARCGSIGDVAAFSFYANKTLTTGEGGMVVGCEEATVARARSAANLFFGEGDRFRHEELGHNYRMNAMSAALGLSQLGRVDAITARKRAVAARYRELLADAPNVRLPEPRPNTDPVPWMAAVVVEGRPAREVATELAASGVETRPFFVGMHEQPALAGLARTTDATFDVTEHLGRHGLYLPSSLSLTEAQIRKVASLVREAAAGAGA